MPNIVVANGSPLSPTIVLEQVIAHYAERNNWYSKFIGTGPESIIQKKTELEKQAGDTIKFTLFAKLAGAGVDGDATLETNEEAPVPYQDTLKIDQKRHATRVAGKMSAQRSAVKIYSEASMLLGTWGKDWMAEVISVGLAGRRGTRALTVLPLTYSGFAGNALNAPDSAHELWAGSAGTQAGMVAGDVFTTALIDKADRQVALLMNSGTPMKFPTANGEEMRALKISPEQWFDLQQDPDWVSAQQNAGPRDKSNSLFTGSKGRWKGYDIFVDPAAVAFTTTGSVTAYQAQILGCQAGMLAFGGVDNATEGGGGKWAATTEKFDYGNQTGFALATILGFKKAEMTALSGGSAKDNGCFSIYSGATA